MEKAEGKTKRTQITIRIAVDLLDRIKSLAEKERRNRSNMIEYLLREQMREAAEW
jgi:hypothetical protein